MYFTDKRLPPMKMLTAIMIPRRKMGVKLNFQPLPKTYITEERKK